MLPNPHCQDTTTNRGRIKHVVNITFAGTNPVKVSLVGAVLFTLQQTQHLPLSRNNLMLFYTLFLIATKVQMMLTHSSTSPFQPIEAALCRLLFSCHQAQTPVNEKVTTTSADAKGETSKKPVEKLSAKISKSAQKTEAKKSD
ncbi:trimeric intracellular cation channel type B [Pelobates cultripes]|uniref:Trimeric intracellular cation channel type B n=1 Tax=Pelobates cultripes TaxID=61616 RepID=A0AAD1W9H4_PELCU|nr:trimeric intracellular cation channel type B [Pelobates cultripes]